MIIPGNGVVDGSEGTNEEVNITGGLGLAGLTNGLVAGVKASLVGLTNEFVETTTMVGWAASKKM